MRHCSNQAFGLFHRIFAAGLSPGGFRLEFRLTLAALLLAAATFGGVFFGIAQAQDANSAIKCLALSSDSPVTLNSTRPAALYIRAYEGDPDNSLEVQLEAL